MRRYLPIAILAWTALAPAQARDVAYPMPVVGFWERVLAGNIDAPGSEAYNRWGDGFLQGIAASDRKFTR